MESTRSRIQYHMQAKDLKIYGGGGDTSRWKLTYTLLPTTEEALPYKKRKYTRSDRPAGRKVSRKLSKRKKPEESHRVRSERGEPSHQPDGMGISQLECEEILSPSDIEGRTRKPGRSDTNSEDEYTEGLHIASSPDTLYSSYPDTDDYIIESYMLDDLVQGNASLGQDLDIDFARQEWTGEIDPGFPPITESIIRNTPRQTYRPDKGKEPGRNHHG